MATVSNWIPAQSPNRPRGQITNKTDITTDRGLRLYFSEGEKLAEWTRGVSWLVQGANLKIE